MNHTKLIKKEYPWHVLYQLEWIN